MWPCPLHSTLHEQVEAARQRLPPQGAASSALTSLAQPRVSWVSLAEGLGVPAAPAGTCAAFEAALARALATDGPFLIQALLA